MTTITLNDLINNLSYMSKEDILKVKTSYLYAFEQHKNQKRKSGEPYISHPLFVAYILSFLYVDSDTICAALLHDIIEDTKITVDDLTNLFNKDIANLVDEVTKLELKNFSTKEEQNLANTRKIVTSLTKDPRGLIIKFADRLHNMLTLEYHKPIKQIENAKETEELFAPLASHLGINSIEQKLYELSLKYLDENIYKKIINTKEKKEAISYKDIKEKIKIIKNILLKNNINHNIIIEPIDIYNINEKLKKGTNLEDINTFFTIKIIVDTQKDCYQVFNILATIYPKINYNFMDYIDSPKDNMYTSLDCNIIDNISLKIRTNKMDEMDKFGIASYYKIYKENAILYMKRFLHTKCNFYKSLLSMDEYFKNDKNFITNLKNYLLNKNDYIPIIYETKNINIIDSSIVLEIIYNIYGDKMYDIINKEQQVVSKDKISLLIKK